MFSFHSKYFVYRELKRAPQKLSFCFKCPDTGTVRILGNILYARLGVRLQQAYNSALLSNTVSLAKTSFDLVEVECSDIGLVLSDRKTRVLTCNVESQPPLRSRQGQILEEVSDFKYLDSRINSSEKDIKVRNSLAWQALNDTSSIWSSSLFRDLKIRLFQATIDSVLLYGCKGGVTYYHYGSYTPWIPMDHIPPCSAVSITPVGETESPTHTPRRPSNFIRKDRLGLAGHCCRSPELPASQLVVWQPTHGHLRRARSPSVYIHRNPDEGGQGRIHQRSNSHTAWTTERARQPSDYSSSAEAA